MDDLANLTPVDDDLGRAIFDRRVAGVSERQLARDYGLTGKQVRKLIDQHLPTINRELAKRLLGLDLERLDALLKVFYEKAMAGDPVSAGLCLKILERRSVYLGLEVAPARLDPMTANVEPEPRPSSTSRIEAALKWVCDQRTIDGKATEVSAEPPAEPGPSRH